MEKSLWKPGPSVLIWVFAPCRRFLTASCFLFSKASNSPKSSLSVPMGPPVYVDLAYIPNHCSGKNTDPEFFKRVRASYYVVSGNDAANGEPSRAVLDALLEGKSQWGENLQVGCGNAKGCVTLLMSQVLRRRWVSHT